MSTQVYRLLNTGEVTRPGDQYFDPRRAIPHQWISVGLNYGSKITGLDVPHRRPIRSYEDGANTEPGFVPLGKKCGACQYEMNPSTRVCPNCSTQSY